MGDTTTKIKIMENTAVHDDNIPTHFRSFNIVGTYNRKTNAEGWRIVGVFGDEEKGEGFRIGPKFLENQLGECEALLNKIEAKFARPVLIDRVVEWIADELGAQ